MCGCSFLSKVLYRVYRVLGMIRFVRFRVGGYIGFEVIWFRRKNKMCMTLEKMYYVVTMLCSPWQAYRQNKFTMMKIKDLYRSIDTTSNTKSTCCGQQMDT